MELSRRDFIAVTGLFALSGTRVRASSPGHVIVLGAGLSGLSTAYQLASRGIRVTVVEARDRVGGRIFTLRGQFADDLYTETGGELIGDGYERFLKYADQFGLEYQELRVEAETGGSVSEIQDGIGRNAYLRGRFFKRGHVITRHPYGLRGEEASMLPPTLLGKYLRLIGNDVRQGKTSLEQLDRLSLHKELRSRGLSLTALRLIDIALNYNSIKTASAGGVVSDGLRRRSAGTVPLRLKGGNDQLTISLAKAASEKGVVFKLGTAVEAITQSDSGASVIVSSDAGRSTINADRVVCTIPFSVLRRLAVAPSLPRPKRKAISELGYTLTTKVYLQAKYAEWDKRSLGSSVWTDTSLERIFSTTGRPGDERGLFTIWAEGNGSRKLERMSEERRKSYAVREFEKILPFMKGAVEKTDTLSWTTDPFARGAYSHFKVGQLTDLRPHIAPPVGRLHFAGEHTALEKPGMEGALESADRVVREITGG